MTSQQRIEAFFTLGQYLASEEEELKNVISQANEQNPWFSFENIKSALQKLAKNLSKESLTQWLNAYSFDKNASHSKKVGLILAGNIPLVGFHDILCGLLTGFTVQIKLSSDDQYLIPYVLKKLQEIEPRFEKQIEIVERLKGFDCIIATGSNNTSRYFEYYFKDVPHIIRKNRNGIAILTGKESKEELQALGHDIFDYFGLGCRNVSKIYFPKNYHYPAFFEAIESFSSLSNHYKYNNNYEYNKSIYLINREEHLDNGFLLLKKDGRLASPLAVVYFEEYENLENVEKTIAEKKQEIQCIVGPDHFKSDLPVIPFGESQSPGLSDYADGVDVIHFLIQQL